MKTLRLIFITVFLLGLSDIAQAVLSLSTVKSFQTTLRVLYNVRPSPDDYVSTNNEGLYGPGTPGEADLYPLEGQIYYVPHLDDSERNPLYRLYNGYKHMDSPAASEADYWAEGILGYAWKAAFAPPGTEMMFRGYNPSNGDHSILNVNYQLSGFSNEDFVDHYAYHRFTEDTKMFPLNGSAISLKSNLIAGGIIWELWWNGKQFLDNGYLAGYGRQIQSSLNLGEYFDGAGSYNALPTEGGDDNYFHQNKAFINGAPILMYSNQYASGYKQQTTKAIPLEWNHVKFNGTGNPDHPVIYKDFYLGKRITLDMQSLNLGQYSYLRPQIMKYETLFYTPATLPYVHIEIPTGYLPSSEFGRFFEIDAANQGLNEVSDDIIPWHPSHGGFHLCFKEYVVEAGGLAIANSDLTYAMGVYFKRSNQLNQTGYYYFRNWKFEDTSKWSAAHYGTMNAGENIYTSYIVVGTLDDVRNAMRALYLNGY